MMVCKSNETTKVDKRKKTTLEAISSKFVLKSFPFITFSPAQFGGLFSSSLQLNINYIFSVICTIQMTKTPITKTDSSKKGPAVVQ